MAPKVKNSQEVSSSTVPLFVQQINSDYGSKISHTFILHGNIYDYVDNAGNDLNIKKVLCSCYDDNIIDINSKGKKKKETSEQEESSGVSDPGLQSSLIPRSEKKRIIVFYNSALGTEVPNLKSFALWKATIEQDLSKEEKEMVEIQGDKFFTPTDLGQALTLFNRWFNISKKLKLKNQTSIITSGNQATLVPEIILTLVFTDSDCIFPAGNISQLGGDRFPIVYIRNWAQDSEDIGDRTRIILMTRHLSDIHESIRGELAVSQLVRKPNLQDRLEYITNYNETIKIKAAASGGTFSLNGNIFISKINLASDFTIQEFATQSAGMNRRQIKDVIFNSWRSETPIDFRLVRERKKRALDDEYEGMIDIKEPSFGFDQIGGHEHFKDYCRWEIIKPLKEGNKRLCSRGALMTGPPGCQPAGSKVLMSDGTWKTVENIVVGDKVISPQHDNSSIISTVIETVSYDNHDIYEIATKGRTHKSYRCADNHIVPFNYLSRPRNKGIRQSRVYKLAELKAVDILNLGISRSKVTFTSPAVDFSTKEYKIHPYLMGAVLGDGGLTDQPGFTGSQQMLDKLQELGVIYGKTKTKKGNSFGVNFIGETSELFRNSLIYGKTSYTKFVPEEYKLGSIDQRLELLAGLIDTDGSKDSYTSCSKQLAEDFVYLVHSVGGMADIKSRTTKCQTGATCLSYRVHYAFAEHRPNLVNKHKDQGERDLTWKNPRNRDFTVTKVGNETVHGFVLDSPSEWYITDDWMVTHNTGKSFIAWALAKEAGLNFIQVDLGKVFGGLVGQTEGNMRKLLEAIEAAAPCIVFVDEIDSVLSSGRTSSGDSGTSARVFNSFMSWLSDPGRVGKVVCLAASNRPDLLDAALIRSGRMDVKIPMLPPAKGDRIGRLEILGALSNKHKIVLSKELLATKNGRDGLGILLGDETRVWTGAEIEQLLQAAFRKTARADRKLENGEQDLIVTIQDWEAATRSIVPNTKEVERMTKLALYYVDNLDYVPEGAWRDLAMQKDLLAAELGIQ